MNILSKMEESFPTNYSRFSIHRTYLSAYFLALLSIIQIFTHWHLSRYSIFVSIFLLLKTHVCLHIQRCIGNKHLRRYLNVYYSCFKALFNTLHLLYLMSIEVAIPSSVYSHQPILLLSQSAPIRNHFSPSSKNRILSSPSSKHKHRSNFTG